MESDLLSIDMKPKPFNDMSQNEAERFLAEFVETEKKVLADTIRLKKESGDTLDIGRLHIVHYFEEFDPMVRPKYRDWGDRLPQLMQTLPEHVKGERFFDESARMCLLRMGYYFGDCLLEEFPHLSWSVGDRKYARSGEPVIIGFFGKIECAPIHVCTTIISRIDRLGLEFNEFLNTLDVWRSKAAAS